MGVNNRARRVAKKRKRTSGRPGGTGAASHRTDWYATGAAPSGRELAEVLIDEAVGLCEGDERTADRLAGQLLGAEHLGPELLGAALERLLRYAVHGAVRGGWGPHDLAELLRRRLTIAHLPVLAAALQHETQPHPAKRVAPQWRDELAALGTTTYPALHSRRGLTLGLTLAAILRAVPVIPFLMPPPGEADPLAAVRVEPGGQDAKVLAKVRALLAKAESTDYAEEAEALSGKAQQLISRYSLDRLVAEAAASGKDTTTIVGRRLWLDAPYVSAKANLVAQVAHANRCSTVLAEKLGFTTVAGTATDIDAVEVLSTSLMVQADTAMLRAGRLVDRDGTSRTASYRRSFLLAYAHRIGERLAEADQAAGATVAESTGGGALVPVLRDHGERVEAALAEMFPHVVHKRTSVGNWQGWAEGRAAADQARLSGQRPISG
jgi:hypothetical protein